MQPDCCSKLGQPHHLDVHIDYERSPEVGRHGMPHDIDRPVIPTQQSPVRTTTLKATVARRPYRDGCVSGPIIAIPVPSHGYFPFGGFHTIR